MTVTQGFIDSITSAVITQFETDLSHMAVGDDDTTPVDTDTTLGNETYREAFFNEVTDTTYRAELFLDTTENNGNDIKECGLFTAGAGGDMYARSLTNVINKTTSIEVFIEYVINFEVINV